MARTPTTHRGTTAVGVASRSCCPAERRSRPEARRSHRCPARPPVSGRLLRRPDQARRGARGPLRAGHPSGASHGSGAAGRAGRSAQVRPGAGGPGTGNPRPGGHRPRCAVRVAGSPRSDLRAAAGHERRYAGGFTPHRLRRITPRRFTHTTLRLSPRRIQPTPPSAGDSPADPHHTPSADHSPADSHHTTSAGTPPDGSPTPPSAGSLEAGFGRCRRVGRAGWGRFVRGCVGGTPIESPPASPLGGFGRAVPRPPAPPVGRRRPASISSPAYMG